MNEKRFALSMPEGTGLLTCLEKGEKGPATSLREHGGDVHELRVEDGKLVVPPELEKRLGLLPGSRLEIVFRGGRAEVLPNIHSLNRLSIEPTSRCNLSCRTCIRNTWDEPMGDMDASTFERLAGQLRRFPHLESVMFGGFGEPTVHPRILDMVRAVKGAGLRTEMTTNATLLDEAMVEGLLEAGLDEVWISLDGTTEESLETIRPGAGLARVLENAGRLAGRNGRAGRPVEIGIAFVLTRTNLRDVRRLDRLARSIGARRIIVSHVLPYTEAMEKEMLCLQTLTLETFTFAPARPRSACPGWTSTTRPRRPCSVSSRASRT